MSKAGSRGRWNSDNLRRYDPNKKIDDTRWVRKKGVWRLETAQKSEPDYCYSRRERAGFRRGAKLRSFNQPTTHREGNLTVAKAANVELLIKNVRFSYLFAFNPFIGTNDRGERTENYCSHFIMAPDHPDMAAVKAAITQVVKDAFPNDWQEVLVEMKAKNKLCLKDGSLKAGQDGYKGMKFISGNKKTRFSVIETRGGVNVQLTQADGRPLSGDYGNALIAIYYMSHKKGGRMVNCDIQGIQYTRKGTPLGGGGRVAEASEFGLEASDADGAAPAAAGATSEDNTDLLG